MLDQLTESLSSIKSHHLPGLDLGEELVHPHYDGYSILNTPSSICGWGWERHHSEQPLLPLKLRSHWQMNTRM